MENYSGKSIKYLIILVLLIGAFVALIGHAYNYLPKNENNVNIEKPIQEDFLRYENNNTPEQMDDETSTRSEYDNSQVYDNLSERYRNSREEEALSEKQTQTEQLSKNDFEEIQNNEITESDNIYAKAEQLKSEKKYESAVYEYQKIVKETNDAEVQAECNEKIAIIYAEIKRYGSAIAYAQKAYNTAPNTQRELLLARLYYKTGDIDKATSKVNDILKRDFIEEPTK